MTHAEISDLIDLNLASGNKIPATKHREVEHALLDFIQLNSSQPYDIKEIDCDLAYLTANFEVNGLGKNLRLGWAICNGNNGTKDRSGRVSVGYGTGYSALGGLGGSKDAVIVEHSHGLSNVKRFNNIGPNIGLYDRSNGAAASGLATDSVGVSGTDKNMQPYIITLYIMKL